jgi:hypothetical protein
MRMDFEMIRISSPNHELRRIRPSPFSSNGEIQSRHRSAAKGRLKNGGLKMDSKPNAEAETSSPIARHRKVSSGGHHWLLLNTSG